MKLPVPPRWWTVSVTAVVATGVLVVGTVRAVQQTEVVTVPGASVTVTPAGKGHAPAHATAEPSRFLTPPASHGPLPARIPVYTPSTYYTPHAAATHAVPVTPPRAAPATTPATVTPPTPTATPTPVPTPDPAFSSSDPAPTDSGDENVPSSDPGIPGGPWHRGPHRVDYVVPDQGPPGTVNGW